MPPAENQLSRLAMGCNLATLHVTQKSLVYILKIIGAETDRAGSRVIKMLHCVVRSFNQLNIYYYKNTKTMAVLWCHMHMLLSHSSDECLTLLLLL